MRSFLILGLMLFVTACSTSAPTAVGKWEASGGLAGVTLILNPDGTGTFTSLAEFSMKPETTPVTWQTDGNSILVTKGKRTDTLTLSEDGETLLLLVNDDQAVFRRAGGVPSTE